MSVSGEKNNFPSTSAPVGKTLKRLREDNDEQEAKATHDAVDSIEPDAKRIKAEKIDENKDDYNFTKPLSIPKKVNEVIPSQNQEILSQEDEMERMQLLVASFTEEQHNRYEMYRRGAFPKTVVKRLIQNVVGPGTSVPQNVVIAMSGIAKVFVGEVIELALDVKEQWEHSGPIQPQHIREAVRRMRSKGMVPHSVVKKRVL